MKSISYYFSSSSAVVVVAAWLLLCCLCCLPTNQGARVMPRFPRGPPRSLDDFKHRNQFVESSPSSHGTPPPIDGTKEEVVSNVVGGTVVRPPFKYSRFIGAIQKGDFQFCAGSLFAENLFVTAARTSCFFVSLS